MTLFRSEYYESKEINGSQIMRYDFAPVDSIIRFTFPGKNCRGCSNYVFIPETPKQQSAENKAVDKDVDDRIYRT